MAKSMQEYYNKGVIDKCAEYGIDPRELVKRALNWGAGMKGALKGGLTYGAAGAALGTLASPVGTAVGGVLGMTAGGLKEGIKGLFSKNPNTNNQVSTGYPQQTNNNGNSQYAKDMRFGGTNLGLNYTPTIQQQPGASNFPSDGTPPNWLGQAYNDLQQNSHNSHNFNYKPSMQY
jgi:hypothetical protein